MFLRSKKNRQIAEKFGLLPSLTWAQTCAKFWHSKLHTRKFALSLHTLPSRSLTLARAVCQFSCRRSHLATAYGALQVPTKNNFVIAYKGQHDRLGDCL